MAPGLSIHIAEKRFGATTLLLADFALEIRAGEVVAITGPSGIGKSSLLRMVAGIDRDFAGKILVDGVEAAKAPAPGFVFQEARLLPWLSVTDNIRLAQPSLADEALAQLLDQVGLAGRGADFPRQLSGGMQRRAALARALAGESGLLLLDEPFVSLDAALASEMRNLVAYLIAARKSTVLLVTHDMAEAEQLAERVLVLEGRPVRIAAG